MTASAFAAELRRLEPALGAAVGEMFGPDGDAAGRERGRSAYAELVSRLREACDREALDDWAEVCEHVLHNLAAAGPEHGAPFATWTTVALIGLEAESPVEHRAALEALLTDAAWPMAMAPESLAALLGAPPASAAAPAEYDESALGLGVPEDTDPRLVESFLHEAPEHAARLAATVQELMARGPSADELLTAQRIAHTLKGAASTVGVDGITTVAHELEDVLTLADEPARWTDEVADCVVALVDCLEAMVESVGRTTQPPDGALDAVRRSAQWRHAAAGGAPAPRAAPRAPVPAPAAAPAPAPAEAEFEAAVRVPYAALDDMLRVIGEASVAGGQLHERLRDVLARGSSLGEHGVALQARIQEFESLIDIQGLPFGTGAGAGRGAGGAGEFDPLEFDQYNEVHSHVRGLVEAAADATEHGAELQRSLRAIEAALARQRALLRELQQRLIGTRMVPVKTLVPRLQRCVRQTCRMTAKRALLETSGEELRVDAEVLARLADPLIHLLRNAIDHGLEYEDERELHGKAPVGRLHIAFEREGGNVTVTCRDDGRGLDFEAIRDAALERGLLAAGAAPSREELTHLVFAPGFSTRGAATQVSGRGIGMEAVSRAVRELRGSLDLKSEDGAGCVMRLRIPVSLMSLQSLLVAAGGRRYAVPAAMVERVLSVAPGMLHDLGADRSLIVEQRSYPAVSLGGLLAHAAPAARSPVALLVQDGQGGRAVLVEQVIASQELLLKPLGALERVPGVSGAALLADGGVVLVLDLVELFAGDTAAPDVASGRATPDAAASAAGTRILVVEDSLSARRAMAQLLGDSGYEVRLAKDGVDAVGLLEQWSPDLVVADLELPRMNGLELTTHLRAGVATRDTPVLMITSRRTEKHRAQARKAGVSAYLTKPYLEAEVLDEIHRLLGDRHDRRSSLGA